MTSSSSLVEVLNSTHQERWNEAFASLPHELRDINFTYFYNRLYELNGEGELQLFLYREDSELFYYPFLLREIKHEISAEIYRDIETVYGYSGPISGSTDPSFVERATMAFKAYCKQKNVVCEFIRFHPILKNHSMNSVDPLLKIVPLRDYVYVDLKNDDEVIWNEYSSQNRNKIRKAEKSGVRVIAGYNERAYKEFVKMYLENMHQVNAAPMYFFSDIFFSELAKLVQAEGVFLEAKHEGGSVGAAVFLGGISIGHYFLAAASGEGKKIAAGNLLLHHGVMWAKQNGLKKLHLGGGVSADPNDPLLVFKKNFSGHMEKFYIGKRVHNNEAYQALVSDWDTRFPEVAGKYKNILQRYRWTKADII
ncbi:MAG TPA: GNAT family N-acetyltransferase [Bacteroidia bacterium]|nr:GNAT family N-acetyltransferase [Bacteroidia bacterium]